MVTTLSCFCKQQQTEQYRQSFPHKTRNHSNYELEGSWHKTVLTVSDEQFLRTTRLNIVLNNHHSLIEVVSAVTGDELSHLSTDQSDTMTDTMLTHGKHHLEH
jgi:hypothetical protein